MIVLINKFKRTPSGLKIILLVGPTSSRKTDLTMLLSNRLPIEVISVDSAMIYRDMNIGTAKPTLRNLFKVPHRLINIRDPSEYYSVAEFCQDALREIREIFRKGKIPLLVGGTLFYFHSLLDGGISILPPRNRKIRLYIERESQRIGWKMLHAKLKEIDIISANRIHPNDSQRISRALEIFFVSGKTITELSRLSFRRSVLCEKCKIYKFVIFPTDRMELHKRIEKRFFNMLSDGFEDEVRYLFCRGDLNLNMSSIRCVGYRQMWLYLLGKISYDNMIYQGICSTRQLAKRQMTWLKKWNDVFYLNTNDIMYSLDKMLHVVHGDELI
ncbi:MAG: tRNA dimethylallyltransferase [Candidatus Westeberhardia cardiocondylae]|nr:tRNA dimethylallyltransferase [Candidatus Westeberhardia cardiocondylae]